MPELLINGLPVIPPSPPPPAHQRWGMDLSTLQAVAELTEWTRRHLGVVIEPALVELLGALEPIHRSGGQAALEDLAAASSLGIDEVERLVAGLAGSGVLQVAVDAGRRRIVVTEQLAAVMAGLRQRLGNTLLARSAARERHLLNRIADANMRRRIDALFDAFDELEWLHLYHWGSSCYLMAALVASALRGMGIPAHEQPVVVEAHHGRRRLMLGARGRAMQGQIDGHVGCIAGERWLVDFGLGNARRQHNRRFYWGWALDLAPEGQRLASWHDSRVGQVSVTRAELHERGSAQLALCRNLATELLRRHGWTPG